MDEDLFAKTIENTFKESEARSKLKLCIHCKWSEWGKYLEEYECKAPQNFKTKTEFCIVTGKSETTKKARYLTCKHHRVGEYAYDYSCNASGDWFEVKE